MTAEDDTLAGDAPADEWTTATIAASPSPSRQLRSPSADPDRIGRYLVIERLGAGAMGVVLAAYDPELDRKLAIKLIRPGREQEHDQARMLREAQAMAKVAHPNVIAVYDVGAFADQVYIAMELVPGRSLGDLLDASPVEQREVDEILGLFVQAGRGLAAAHEVGLVHRDFKPDNVLVGDDGRVRVLDFGLARANEADEAGPGLDLTATLDDSASASMTAGHSRASRSRLSQEMTRAGVLIGTPAYMPPEHLAGRRSDARGDQFSFCVALWEGLYGRRPFVGKTLPALFDALLEHRVVEPPAALRARVPDWLHTAVVRGIASDPEDRWPDMAGLLLALQPPAPRRPRWLALVVAGLASVVVGVGVWQALHEPDPPSRCADLDARLDGVWDEERRAGLRASFAASGHGYASRSADAIVHDIDAWTAAWVTARTAACEATHVRGEQSEALLDLRMACLDRRLAGLDALLGVLEQGDAELLERAAEAVAGIEDLDSCADVEALRERAGPPRDPVQAERVAAVEVDLDELEALVLAGRYQAAQTKRDALSPIVATLAWPPTRGRFALVRGQLDAAVGERDSAGLALVEALAVSLDTGDDELAAKAAVELVWTMRAAPSAFAQLPLWQRLAEAQLDRRGDPRLRARLEQAAGVAMWEQADYDGAIVRFERALALLEEQLGPDHLQTISVQGELANIYQAKGELDRARALLLDTRQRYLRELGPEHPWVARVANHLGGVEWKAGDYAKAGEYYAEALAIRERAFGPEHPTLASPIANLGVIASMNGDYDQAASLFARAIELYRSEGDSKLLASTLDNLAACETRRGNNDEAMVLYRDAYEVRKRIHGLEHPELARSLINMAQLETQLGDPAAASELLERAIALREDVDVDVVYRARARWQLAEALAALGEHARVPELLELAAEDYRLAGVSGNELIGFEAAVARLSGP